VDVEICNVCTRKVIIEAAKRIINSDKMCRSYSDLNFGVTFLEHSVLKLSSLYPKVCCGLYGVRLGYGLGWVGLCVQSFYFSMGCVGLDQSFGGLG